jgi:hypothetical protein
MSDNYLRAQTGGATRAGKSPRRLPVAGSVPYKVVNN